MPSTYTVNLGIEKPATGEQSGTWGDTTNVNFDILDQAINGAARVTLTSAGSSGSPNALQITNGATSDGRNKWVEFYSSGDLGGSVYVQLDPNDAEKIVFVRNSLAGSRSILLFQGTYNSGRDLEVPAGVDMVVKFDGGGASAATVTDVFTKLRATEITTPTLTATTADINGGTIDNSVIGGSTAAAVTGTAVVANTSLNIAGDGATVTGIKDEDNMASNSATKLATQQSIKAYVDSQVGTVDTWAEVLANGATSGSTNPEVTAGQALKTDTINETSAGSGVTIDSVLLKDDVVNATDVETGSISANDGTASATIADTTGNFTITNFISNSVDIGGGNIDGTTIGGSSAAAGSFTTLTGATINATTVIDTPDIETSVISARDGTTAINIANSDGDMTFPTQVVMTNNNHAEGSLYLQSTAPVIGFTDTNSFTDVNDIIFVRAGTNNYQLQYYDDSASATRSLQESSLTATIFNEDSLDIDFRVESDSNSHMLFVDANNNDVRIGTSNDYGSVLILEGDLTANVSSAGTVDVLQLNNSHGYGAGSGIAASALAFGRDNSLDGNGIQIVNSRIYSGNLDETTSNGSQFSIDVQNGSNVLTNRVYMDNDGIVFNESSNDLNFRVESSTNAYGLYLDGGTETVSIGTAATDAKFRVDATTADFRVGYSTGYNYLDAHIASIFRVTSSSTEGMRVSATAVEINDGSADRDFRVESNNNANMLFVDGGNDRVNVGGTSALGTLCVESTGGTTNLSMKADADQFAGIFYNNGTSNKGALLYNNDTNTFTIRSNGVTSFEIAPTEIALNNASNDMDFRVESNSNTHMLFVDGGNDAVGIGTSSAGSFTIGDLVVGDGVGARGVTIYAATDNEAIIRFADGTSGDQQYRGQIKYNHAEDSLNFHANGASSSAENLILKTSEAVFNEGGINTDFRVESDGNANMLFVDAGNNRITMGGNDGTGSLTVKNVDSGGSDVFIHAQNAAANRIAGFKVLDEDGDAQVTLAHDNGSDTPYLTLQKENEGNMSISFDGSDAAVASNSSSALLNFKTSSTTRMSIAVGGALTTSPIDNGHATFNEGSANADFRVETNDNANMLFIDGGGNYINVGTSGGRQTTAILHSRANGANYEFGHGNNSAGYFGTIGAFGNNGMPYIGFSTTVENAANTFSTFGSPGHVINGNLAGELLFQTVDTATATGQTPINRMSIGTSGMIVNDASDDYDFRVESNAYTHMFFIDGGNDKIGVGTSSPNRSFQVDNALSANIVNFHYLNVVSAYRISSGTATRNVRVEFGSGGEYWLKMYIVGLWAYEGAGYGTVTIEVTGFGGEERFTVIETTKTGGGTSVTATVSADNDALNVQISSTHGSWRWSAMTEMVHGPSGAYVSVDGTNG